MHIYLDDDDSDDNNRSDDVSRQQSQRIMRFSLLTKIYWNLLDGDIG
jgi:hypothetical protein